MDLVSIIIPNFNKAEYISETLKSVLDQSENNWEAIIVDDGSEDESVSIIEAFAIKDSRIRLIIRTGEKRGGSVCRNVGLQNANGNYVLFLDSDDVLSENCLARRLHFSSLNKNAEFYIFPIGTFISKIGDSQYIWKVKEDNHLLAFLSHKLPWHTMSTLWRKDFLLEIGGFDESFPRLQDVEIHTRALLKCSGNYEILKGEEIDAFYRIGEDRIENKGRLLKSGVKGMVCYLDFFQDTLSKSEKKRELRYLKGSILSMINNINNQYQFGVITKEEKKQLINELRSSKGASNLIGFNEKMVLSFYQFGYSLYFNKVKGYNYTFKALFIRV